MEKDGQQKEFVSPREFFIERGEWQKEYVCKLVEQGVSYGHAMIAMGLTCEERLKSYMQGYERGYNDRDTQTRNKPQHSGVPNMTTKEKLDSLTVHAKSLEGCLDDLIHDLKSKEASDINNAGTESQILFIVASLGAPKAIQEIEDELGLTPVEEDVNEVGGNLA